MSSYIFLILIGLSAQLTFAVIDETFQNFNISGIGELPGNLTSKLPSETDIEEALTKKCQKLEGPEAGMRVTKAKNEATECIKGLVDINQLQEEMEKAKPTGDLDSVFKKYCKKTPEFKGCVSTFTDSLKPCLEEEEKQGMATVLNVTEQLAEFICFKEGDRIALFIAEGGPECLESSKDDVWKCVETVFKKHIPNTEEVTINDIPLLLFKAEQCKDFHNLQTCVVKQLEKCKEPTPANIIDSLFNFVKKATPCASYKFVDESVEAANKSQAGRTSSFSLSLYAVLIGVTLLRLTASVTN